MTPEDTGKPLEKEQPMALHEKEPKSWLQYHSGRNQRKDRKNTRRRRAAGMK